MGILSDNDRDTVKIPRELLSGLCTDYEYTLDAIRDVMSLLPKNHIKKGIVEAWERKRENLSVIKYLISKQ
jgi:hypothetical protein